MRVCDRCKQKMDNKEQSKIGSEYYELCTNCSNHIANHIKTYKKGLLEGLMK